MCPNHLPYSRKLRVQGGEQTHGQVGWKQSYGIWASGREYKVEDACRPSEETEQLPNEAYSRTSGAAVPGAE